MDKMHLMLKCAASSLFLLYPSFVVGVALPETYHPQCGYGYNTCSQDYDCVKNTACWYPSLLTYSC